MRAFEIQTCQSGKWSIDSIFDDRELALHEARRMDQSGRYVGVRIVEEVYDEATDRTSTKTIFRGTRTDEVNAQHVERSIDTRREVEADRRKQQARRAQDARARPHPARKKTTESDLFPGDDRLDRRLWPRHLDQLEFPAKFALNHLF